MAKNLEKIQTERLTLRGINESDATEIVEWRSDPEVYRFFKSPHKITVAEHFNWYNNSYLLNENRMDWMCIEKKSGKKIGVFGLSMDGQAAEVNYLLAPDSQHRGYASEAIQCLVNYARTSKNAAEVIAEIHRENEPSIRLIQKQGFHLKSSEGDFVIYAKSEDNP